jgi:hypothetical protein
VRRVRSNGQIKWAGELIFVGEALIGEPVGVLETEGGDWLVRYAGVELGYIHPQRRRLSPRQLRGASGPGDLMEIAAAIPTTPQAPQPQHAWIKMSPIQPVQSVTPQSACTCGACSLVSARHSSAFERMRQNYAGLLRILLTRRAIVPIVAALVLVLGAVMVVFVGRDFYPAIDGGMIQLHVRAPPGTRIETTKGSRRSKTRSAGTTIAVNDGVIMVSLNKGHAPPIMSANCGRYCRRLSPKTSSISGLPTWQLRF